MKHTRTSHQGHRMCLPCQRWAPDFGTRRAIFIVLACLSVNACGTQSPENNTDRIATEGGRNSAVENESDPLAQGSTESLPVCPAHLEAPDLLPGTQPEHLELDYWLEVVSAQVDLDEILLTASEIRDHNVGLEYNQSERPLGLYDLTAPIDTNTLQTSIDDRLEWMTGQFDEARYVDSNGGSLASPLRDTYRSVRIPGHLDGDIHIALGLVPFRCGPSPEAFYTPSLDLRFDRNNCSTAHAQEPVQVLMSWPNGQLLARTRYTIGWIAPDSPLSPPLTENEVARWFEGVAYQTSYELSLSSESGAPVAVPAGTRLVSDDGGETVVFASRTGVHTSAGLRPSDLQTTERDLTRRALLEEAFEYVGAPYGWGGQDGGQDCSRFLLDSFAAFGLELPRHSAYQALAGSFSVDISAMENDTERELLIDAAARSGIVLLHFPGHIMLYLGRDDRGEPMVLHSFAEYLEPCPDGTSPEGDSPDTLFEVDDISISNLDLGRGSGRTAFIERITRVTVLGLDPGIELAGIAELRPAAPLEIPSRRRCRDSQHAAIFTAPARPNRDVPLTVIFTATEHPGPGQLVLIDPEGERIVPEVEHFGGPPHSLIARVARPVAGRWRAAYGDGDRIEACWNFRVFSRTEPVPTAPVFAAASTESGGDLTAGNLVASADTPPIPDSPTEQLTESVLSEPRDTARAAYGFEGDGHVDDGIEMGPIWENDRTWGAATENLFSVWVESLFNYPTDQDLTWTSLHQLTGDPDRNFLHNFLLQDEDTRMREEDDDELMLRLGPDCADLPYLLRAYFAWKLRLPFGYRRCGRGSPGEPPICGSVFSNMSEREFSNDVQAFAQYANRRVRAGVHSASGRTGPAYEFSDYYPVELTRHSLRPGTTYHDPYGHVMILIDWLPQTVDDYGVLLAADAQPDGTVGRRRFWRGSFLFTSDTSSVGAGFKAFRPLSWFSGDDLAGPHSVAYTNETLTDSTRFSPYSLGQYESSNDGFYEAVEGLINPRPLDPIAVQIALVDALEESVVRRVLSVDNGEAHMRGSRWATMEMPENLEIFQTVGPWEDFSTPSRDMRLLISIDTVANFPEVVRRGPERFGIQPDDVDRRVSELDEILNTELLSRAFDYTRSDGSTWTLTLRDVIDRQVDFEMAYNPNDCVEIRWSAAEGSSEYSTCQRWAPEFHRERMRSYRSWFQTRQRPAR